MKVVPRPRKGERVDRCKTWRLTWELPGAGRQQKTETFHGTRPEAEKRWNEVQAQIGRLGSAYVEPSKTKLADYLKEWMEQRQAQNKIAPTTAGAYWGSINTHILPFLGHMPLAGITPAAIEGMLAGMMAGKRRKATSGREAQKARMVLGKALSDAVRLGLILQNPVVRTERPTHVAKKAEAFTPEQVEALFKAAANSRMLPLFQLAYATGMRRGELLGLTWRDVDFQRREVTVRQTLAKLASGGVIVKRPKTSAGERVVGLTSQAIAALNAQRTQQEAEKGAAGAAWQSGDRVFTRLDGAHYNPEHVYNDFCRFRDKAGLPKYPFHALRHTNVAVRVAAGIELEVISKQLGHADIRVTSQIYSHLLPEKDREATDLLDKYLQAKHGG